MPGSPTPCTPSASRSHHIAITDRGGAAVAEVGGEVCSRPGQGDGRRLVVVAALVERVHVVGGQPARDNSVRTQRAGGRTGSHRSHRWCERRSHVATTGQCVVEAVPRERHGDAGDRRHLDPSAVVVGTNHTASPMLEVPAQPKSARRQRRRQRAESAPAPSSVARVAGLRGERSRHGSHHRHGACTAGSWPSSTYPTSRSWW